MGDEASSLRRSGAQGNGAFVSFAPAWSSKRSGRASWGTRRWLAVTPGRRCIARYCQGEGEANFGRPRGPQCALAGKKGKRYVEREKRKEKKQSPGSDRGGGARSGGRTHRLSPFWRQDQCRSSVLHRKFLSSGFWSLRGTQSRRRVFSCCDSGGIEPAIPSIFCFNSLSLLGGPRAASVQLGLL